MSQRNVDIVRGLFAAFERRDNETPFEVYDPAIEWDVTRFSATGLAQVYRGHEGVRAFWREWLEAWETIDFEVVRLVDAPGDVVVSVIRQRNLGRGSGIWVDQGPYAILWRLRDGKVVSVALYEHPEEAMRDAGIGGE
jgi:ketosteroid isomerase-like protein